MSQLSKPAMRVRPVTAKLNNKKQVIKKHVSSVMERHYEQRKEISQIEHEIENDMDAKKEALKTQPEGEHIAGLY